MMRVLWSGLICMALISVAYTQEPVPKTIPKIDCSSPRATMRTFLDAMNDYRLGVETDSSWHRNRLADATYCLNLSPLPDNRRSFYGEAAAIHLKEVIDRLLVIDDASLPNQRTERWQFAETLISIVSIQNGERRGDCLFSSESVKRVQHLYEQVKHLPFKDGSGQGALIDRVKPTQQGVNYVKTDNPRQTVRTFMAAMNDYRKGVETHDSKLKDRINDAVGCLDLMGVSDLVQKDHGRQRAIFLKEVIDRIVVVDYTRIPELEPNGDPILRWRFPGSSNRIAITRVTDGDRAGEYLFSARSVKAIPVFFKEISAKPLLAGSQMGAGYTQSWMDKDIPPWLKRQIVLLPNWQWLGLFLAILLGYLAKAIANYLLSLMKRVADKSKTEWDDKLIDAVQKPVGLMGASAFWYVAVHLLKFEDTPKVVLILMVKGIFSVACIWALYKLVDALTEYLHGLANRTDNDFDDHLVPLVKRASRTFILVFGVLLAVQNLGFNVMSLLAGLGLGGLAFALAAKDTCANLFGSIMILTDRPFQLGEWVKMGGVEGTVEEIGFRSTRVRTFYNSLVTVPNAALANMNIDNMGQRQYRRTVAKLGLTYDTPAEKIDAFTEGIKNVFKANPFVRKDYFHVVFNDYGEFSLNIMIYFFFEVKDWSEELVQRHNVYLEILRLADELDVSFAFPTQSIYLENMPEAGSQPKQPDFTRDQISQTAKNFGPNGESSRPAGSGIFLPPSQDPDLK